MSPAETGAFHSTVKDHDGTWPALPEWFSYSSFTELEDCARRWMLRRATYPRIWTLRGYPDLPSVPSLAGDVIHGALERIITELLEAGCEDAQGESAVQVLRNLGGYTAVLTAVLNSVLFGLDANPRIQERRAVLGRALRQRLPDMREKVQATLGRTAIVPLAAGSGGTFDGRRAVGEGSYAEFEVRAADLRWAGRLDLLTIDTSAVRITDYKTGAPDPHHAEQLRLYALLWARDHEVNPEGRLATDLVLSYPSGEIGVKAPDPTELQELQDDLARRTSAVLDRASTAPPPANPGPERCARCSVRHLCDDFWESGALAHEASGAADFRDAQFVIRSRNGPRSWMASVELPATPTGRSVILRTDESREFTAGDRIRVLSTLVQDDEGELPAFTLTSSSEVFPLA